MLVVSQGVHHRAIRVGVRVVGWLKSRRVEMLMLMCSKMSGRMNDESNLSLKSSQ